MCELSKICSTSVCSITYETYLQVKKINEIIAPLYQEISKHAIVEGMINIHQMNVVQQQDDQKEKKIADEAQKKNQNNLICFKKIVICTMS